MADEKKANEARERLEAAKKAAEEAEFVDTPRPDSAPKTDEAGASAPEPDSPEASAKEGESPAGEAETPSDEAAKTDAPSEEQPVEASAEDPRQTGEELKPEGEQQPDGDVKTDDAQPAEGEAKEPGAEAKEADAAPEPEAPKDEKPAETKPEPTPPAEAQKEAGGGSLAAVVLRYLAILVVGAVVALWAGPRVAPMLPEWAAPAAKFLTPGANETQTQISALKSETEARIAQITSRLDEVETSAGDEAVEQAGALSSRLDEVEAKLSQAIADVAAEPRADVARVNDIATRLAQVEATVQGLDTEIEALVGITGENAPPSAEVLSRVAAFAAAAEGLKAEISVLRDQVAGVETKAEGELVADLAARLAALEEGEAATAGARAEADEIVRGASIDAAFTDIARALRSGNAYAAPLATVENVSGVGAPNLLAVMAESGAPAADSLLRAFPAAAQEAYAAALTAEADDGFWSGVGARLQGRLGGRPASETEGDDAGAILSRIEARLEEGDVATAFEEAGGLADAPRAALGGWLDDLEQAVNAAAALADYQTAVAGAEN